MGSRKAKSRISREPIGIIEVARRVQAMRTIGLVSGAAGRSKTTAAGFIGADEPAAGLGTAGTPATA